MKNSCIILSILLIVCLFNMPYGYYILVRYIAAIVFGVLAYKSYKDSNESLMILWISLAILFQPFIKIPLGRTMWNIVDVIVAIVLAIFVAKTKK